MVRVFHVLLSALIFMVLNACSGGRYVQLSQMGDQAYQDGNYVHAYEYAEQVITGREEKGKNASGNIYALAGKSAWELGNYNKSLEYLEQARRMDYSDEIMYVCLSAGYRRIDNLSKEINALEFYVQTYPGGKDIGMMRARLFESCLESENFALADSLWPLLDDSYKEDVSMLGIYFQINRIRKNEPACDTLAREILDRDPDNEEAMKWFGEKYFWQAENRYQAEMEAYEKRKTNSQYAKLLEAFKTVTRDFKTSLNYFSKLYKLSPKPEYARYLGNIYTRLDDEEKAKYYYSKAN